MKIKLTKKERERIGVINKRLQELSDLLSVEKRGMSNEETEETRALISEKEIIELRAQASASGIPVAEERQSREMLFAKVACALRNNKEVPEECRSLMHGNEFIIPERREVGDTTPSYQDTTSATDIIPVTIGDIIEPLEKGLILNKVGLKMQYGLTGDWVLPIVAGIEATIEDENAEVADTTIDISKLKPSPKRIALKIPVSNSAMDQTNGALLQIVTTQLAMASVRLLNRWMFSPAKINAKASAGCFVKTSVDVKTAWDYKSIVALKGEVMKAGILETGAYGAYVMSAETYAELEATPITTGDSRMIIQDGKINGFPVYVTEYINDTTHNYIGFGVFNYELLAQFGKMRMIVDPYTGAAKNLTYFVFNANYDMLTVRPEAFAVIKKAK